MSVHEQRKDGGRRALVIRPARWVRLLFWLVFAVSVLCILIGLSLGSVGQWGPGALLLVLGVLMSPVGWRGARSRVRVDHRGVLYSAFWNTFVPSAQIASLQVRPVRGAGRVDRAQVAVIRMDGSELRLDPTEVVRSGPDHKRVLAQTGVGRGRHVVSGASDVDNGQSSAGT